VSTVSSEKKSFIKSIPGFRSGVWWKKVLAIIGYLFIALTILVMLLPGLDVEGNVKKAREEINQKDYSMAITYYKDALEQWDNNTTYSFAKSDIETELSDANHQLEVIKNQEKANKLIDEALVAYDKKELDKAISKINEAVALATDYSKIDGARAKMATELKSIADKHIAAAEEALKTWSVTKAQEEIKIATNLMPSHESLESLKKKLAEADKLITEIGPKPENSAWDGAVEPVVKFLVKNLKDPDSVKYESWSNVILADLDGGKCWAVRCTYRAKNSFGGYVLSNQLFYIMNGVVVHYNDIN